jgi:hypothetical protein
MFAAVRPPTLRADDANRMLLLNMEELPLDRSGAQGRVRRNGRISSAISGPR